MFGSEFLFWKILGLQFFLSLSSKKIVGLKKFLGLKKISGLKCALHKYFLAQKNFGSENVGKIFWIPKKNAKSNKMGP